MTHRLHPEMEQFITRVWPGIFAAVLAPEVTRRWSFTGTTDRVSVRIYTIADRLIVHFVDVVDFCQVVTYLTEDTDATGKSFRLQSYDGMYAIHERLIRDAIVGWELHGAPLFKHDFDSAVASPALV